MTVAELIEKLKAMPLDGFVLVPGEGTGYFPAHDVYRDDLWGGVLGEDARIIATNVMIS